MTQPLRPADALIGLDRNTCADALTARCTFRVRTRATPAFESNGPEMLSPFQDRRSSPRAQSCHATLSPMRMPLSCFLATALMAPMGAAACSSSIREPEPQTQGCIDLGQQPPLKYHGATVNFPVGGPRILLLRLEGDDRQVMICEPYQDADSIKCRRTEDTIWCPQGKTRRPRASIREGQRWIDQRFPYLSDSRL